MALKPGAAGQLADWPMYLGDPAHSSYLPAEAELNPSNPSQLQQLWRWNAGAPVPSRVTVANETLFFGAWNARYSAL